MGLAALGVACTAAPAAAVLAVTHVMDDVAWLDDGTAHRFDRGTSTWIRLAELDYPGATAGVLRFANGWQTDSEGPEYAAIRASGSIDVYVDGTWQIDYVPSLFFPMVASPSFSVDTSGNLWSYELNFRTWIRRWDLWNVATAGLLGIVERDNPAWSAFVYSDRIVPMEGDHSDYRESCEPFVWSQLLPPCLFMDLVSVVGDEWVLEAEGSERYVRNRRCDNWPAPPAAAFFVLSHPEDYEQPETAVEQNGVTWCFDGTSWSICSTLVGSTGVANGAHVRSWGQTKAGYR
jgi:hypothetical protein